jgi:hypothetical protein
MRTPLVAADTSRARGARVAVGVKHAGEGRSRGEAQNSDYDQAAHRGSPVGTLLKITPPNVRI